jgi:hypothetical protein
MCLLRFFPACFCNALEARGTALIAVSVSTSGVGGSYGAKRLESVVAVFTRKTQGLTDEDR